MLGKQNIGGRYELSNHLGNVLATVSDYKSVVNSGVGLHYEAVVLTAQDYDPFGMQMPHRQYAVNEQYSRGFNGQERDFEINADGNINTAEYWEYDARLGRRWNIDPKGNVWESSYTCLGNNPIAFNDINGDEFDIANSDKTKSDIESLAREKNRKYLKYEKKENEVAKVNLDFGDMSKKEIKKVLKKDEGLKLIKDMVDAKEKYIYANSLFLYSKGAYGQKSVSDLTKDYNGVSNLSDKGLDSQEKLTNLPMDGYNGSVTILPSTNITFYEKNSSNMLVTKRAAIIFHELAENYEKTTNGIDYNDKTINNNLGAHSRANKREEKWHGQSFNPGGIAEETLLTIKKLDRGETEAMLIFLKLHLGF